MDFPGCNTPWKKLRRSAMENNHIVITVKIPKKNIEDDLETIYKQAFELIEARKEYLIHHKDFNDLKDKIKDRVKEILDKITNLDLDTILTRLTNLDELDFSNISNILPKLDD